MIHNNLEAYFKEWIFNNYRDAEKTPSQHMQKEYVAGEKFPYRGRRFMLRTQGVESKTTELNFKSNMFWVYIPINILKEEWPQQVKEALVTWYKKQAKKVFKEKLDSYAKLLSVQYNQLVIKEQKTKWGSCSKKGNINLNWRVILAPNQVIDYIIIHELAHLRYMNHSKDFWHLISSYLSDYKRWKMWLEENGETLLV